jgi:hypothetical protein
MEFEFDPAKSEANRTKHGIDLVEAQELWKDFYALRIRAKSNTEPRFALIAWLGGESLDCVFYRERFKNPGYFSPSKQNERRGFVP